MKLNISNLFLIFPIIIVSYFLRLGESSFYLFDIYFVFLMFLSAKLLNHEVFVKLLVICLGFFVICFFGVVNSIFNYNIDYQLDRFFAGGYRYFQLLYTFGFFVLSSRVLVLQDNGYLKHIFLLSISFPLLYSLIFYFLSPDKVVTFNRLSSYFGNPNFLGAYICLSIMPIIYTISLVREKMYFIFYILYFIFLLLFNLIFAGSNSYWILSFIVLFLVFISMSKSLVYSLKAIFPILILGIIGYFVLSNIQFDEEFSGVSRTLKLLETLMGGGDVNSLGSGGLRSSLAGEAITFVMSSVPNILFGIGLGQSPIIIGAMHGGFVTAHNAHIVLFMEIGVLGYLYFMFALFYFLSRLKISRVSLSFLATYFLAMLATPHVYMPFLWGIMVYGLFIYRLNIIRKCE